MRAQVHTSSALTAKESGHGRFPAGFTCTASRGHQRSPSAFKQVLPPGEADGRGGGELLLEKKLQRGPRAVCLLEMKLTLGSGAGLNEAKRSTRLTRCRFQASWRSGLGTWFGRPRPPTVTAWIKSLSCIISVTNKISLWLFDFSPDTDLNTRSDVPAFISAYTGVTCRESPELDRGEVVH